MSPRILPKTLAKTISFIACTAPSEYGLFWDAEGTMPWKELYWALQEDPQLRFVREPVIKELELIGLDLPFTLQSGQLRAKDPAELPKPEACSPPATLYYWARRKQYRAIMQNGLIPSASRSYVALFSDKDVAKRRAQRRDPQPVLVTVTAGKAHEAGISFLNAGSDMFLCPGIPVDYLVFAPVSEEDLNPFPNQKKRERKPQKRSPKEEQIGSFLVAPEHFGGFGDEGEAPGYLKKEKKRGKGPDWKRQARKDRRKRDIDGA
jgi:putative RNA 2'-phosphotransferase